MLNFNYSAPVAQLDRASGYEPEGREFESLRAHHYFRPLAETRRSRVPRRGGLRAHHFSCHVFCLRPAIGIHKTFLHRFHERSLAAPLPAQFRRNQIHQEPRTLEAGPQRRICDTIRSDAPRKLSEIRKGKRPHFRIAQKAASVAQFDIVRPLAETRRSRAPRRGGLPAHHFSCHVFRLRPAIGIHSNFQFQPAKMASVSASTTTPRSISSGEAYSSGRWLYPFLHGINSMATGAMRDIKSES